MTPAAPRPGSRLSRDAGPRWLIALALLGLVAAVFHPVREHDFVGYDDHVYITDNPDLRAGLTPGNVVQAFTESFDANWIPLTRISLQLDSELYGLELAGFLLTDVAFPALSALLLFAALVRMTRAMWPSAFVAAVFAVHPLHVESVAWAAERKDALAAATNTSSGSFSSTARESRAAYRAQDGR